MKNEFKFFLIVITIALFASSCTSTKRINRINTASSYVDEYSGKFLKHQIYHQNDSMSELVLQIKSAMIPGLKEKPLEVYSLMTLNYEVFTSMKKKDIHQSDSYKLSEILSYDQLNEGGVELKIPLKLYENTSYVLILSMKDQANKKNYQKIIKLTKDRFSPENFRITNGEGALIWKHWLKKGDKMKVQFRYPKVDEIHMSYFEPKFSPAKSPYYESDSKNIELENTKVFEQFELSLTNGISQVIELPKNGAYIFHDNKDLIQGKLITMFYNDFPKINKSSHQVFALRYLNDRKDFSKMLKDDPGHTIQEFWFFEGRTKERSEQMMKTYYNRVLRANELFTSYKEGWKTDRGMVFMIYGPPDVIYNEDDREVWEYGANASYNDLRFDFMMTKTFLNNQEYLLIRSYDYKKSWHKVVENWRNE